MHFSSSSFLVVAAAATAHAQKTFTPSGFTPAASTQLDVLFNSTAVSTPGELLSKAATAAQPQLALASSAVSPQDTYVFVMLDLDVPPQGADTTRRVLLHAMNTGFKATQQSVAGGAVLLASSDKGPAKYIGPGPPATDTIPHRYTQLLFKQPASLQVSADAFADTQARFDFDVKAFAKEMGLGEPVAGNFFMVDGRVSAAAAPSGTRGAEFQGKAAAGGMPWGIAGLLGVSGLAFMAL
ncbi:PEBP-like protein [Bimuria novae-zelandiae CBS 107.79]|uniref:PEBP-like protein n=1 Tax=Bimuria novae-zelandiae CBS 107.79 TaxID=1447943 RepID=A0A6A5UY94_9PLEO|nr:PEBP-like protein [Bimuria novae-zelandiae CBS 107.79]